MENRRSDPTSLFSTFLIGIVKNKINFSRECQYDETRSVRAANDLSRKHHEAEFRGESWTTAESPLFPTQVSFSNGPSATRGRDQAESIQAEYSNQEGPMVCDILDPHPGWLSRTVSGAGLNPDDDRIRTPLSRL